VKLMLVKYWTTSLASWFLERVSDVLLAANPAAVASLNMDVIRQDVVNELQKKYPNSDISLKG
jgi:hypothetical protein